MTVMLARAGERLMGGPAVNINVNLQLLLLDVLPLLLIHMAQSCWGLTFPGNPWSGAQNVVINEATNCDRDPGMVGLVAGICTCPTGAASPAIGTQIVKVQRQEHLQ